MNALYRGKRIDTGEWVYGMPHKDGYLVLIISENIESWDTDYINPEWWWRVIPATVGQYTGLDDKNGVKIFAGDILACGDGDVPTEVFWNEVDNCWSALNLRRNETHRMDRHFKRFVGEVIGNIHDKEEL